MSVQEMDDLLHGRLVALQTCALVGAGTGWTGSPSRSPGWFA